MIAAEGEQKASKALKEAADVINESPFAIQLRYLQTLSTISAEKNSTIIFPLPVDLVTQFMHRKHSSVASSIVRSSATSTVALGVQDSSGRRGGESSTAGIRPSPLPAQSRSHPVSEIAASESNNEAFAV